MKANRTDGRPMDKELCLNFLVHLHNCASAVLKKAHIDAVDITYLNNEVDNFRGKIDWEKSFEFDKTRALGAINRIPEESIGDKALFLSKFLLKAKFKWLSVLFGAKDDAQVQRERKVGEFREQVRKILALIEYSA